MLDYFASPALGGDLKRTCSWGRVGGCQNYGPLLDPLTTRCRVILRTQKGTMILTTTHIPIHDANVVH